jgi:hypothetical protein
VTIRIVVNTHIEKYFWREAPPNSRKRNFAGRMRKYDGSEILSCCWREAPLDGRRCGCICIGLHQETSHWQHDESVVTYAGCSLANISGADLDLSRALYCCSCHVMEHETESMIGCVVGNYGNHEECYHANGQPA